MSTNNDALTFTKHLIACPSITPDDANCQTWIAQKLVTLGFNVYPLRCGEVTNLWAQRGTQAPLFTFLGHTDVVDPGPIDQWQFPPFCPTEHQGFLYGRGAADMKSSIAAMLVAYTNFIHQFPHHSGALGFLLTSDEEGPAVNGTCKVMEYLQQQNIHIDWCLVGEPSSQSIVGDIIKVGRRGSLSFTLTIHGKQGHIAYPHLANNAIHCSLPALLNLIAQQWDEGNKYFPATCLQFSHIHAGTGATNIIPGKITLQGNFRYSSAVTAEILQQRLQTILQQHQLSYDIQWQHNGNPFLTAQGKLRQSTIEIIEEMHGAPPILSTDGGTSDGRFVAPYGTEVIELGVSNQTIHQINEKVKIEDIYTLTTLYQKILQKLFLNS